MARCAFKKRDGSPCEGVAKGSHGGCYSHDGDFALDRRRNAKRGGTKGGRGRQNPGTADLARLGDWFERLARDVEEGRADRSDAAIVGQLLNGARACIQTSAKLREVEEFEARLDALEGRRGGTA
jgi:hypothetical protein